MTRQRALIIAGHLTVLENDIHRQFSRILRAHVLNTVCNTASVHRNTITKHLDSPSEHPQRFSCSGPDVWRIHLKSPGYNSRMRRHLCALELETVNDGSRISTVMSWSEGKGFVGPRQGQRGDERQRWPFYASHCLRPRKKQGGPLRSSIELLMKKQPLPYFHCETQSFKNTLRDTFNRTIQFQLKLFLKSAVWFTSDLWSVWRDC